MKLHGSYTSPYVRHCRIALMSSNLAWEFVETDYATSAKSSPTQRVPFLIDGETQLTDSTSILFYIAQKTDGVFLESTEQTELYCMTNTVMDTAINLFLLERDGITPDNSDYLMRQLNRIQSGLIQLSDVISKSQLVENTATVRLACFLEWALFRERISLQSDSPLLAFLKHAQTFANFKQTVPAA